jgi:ribonuclease P protein component
MLPREKRLADTRDFKRVYQKGSFFSGRLSNINFLPNKMSVSRLGVVVSKKISGKATVRNKVKRRFREVSKSLYDLLPKGLDVILSIKPGAEKAEFADIAKEGKEVFGKVAKK